MNAVTVWCGYWSKRFIGGYFLENEDEQDSTVNEERSGISVQSARYFLLFRFSEIHKKVLENLPRKLHQENCTVNVIYYNLQDSVRQSWHLKANLIRILQKNKYLPLNITCCSRWIQVMPKNEQNSANIQIEHLGKISNLVWLF